MRHGLSFFVHSLKGQVARLIEWQHQLDLYHQQRLPKIVLHLVLNLGWMGVYIINILPMVSRIRLEVE